MRDDDQRRRSANNTIDRSLQRFRIECREALVQNHEVCILKQRASDEEATLFSV